MELTGADIVVRCLKEEGVEHVFGYPGGAVLHIYDALYAQNDIKHVLVRHEQAATHAADGYARASGKPGVVLVTSGSLLKYIPSSRSHSSSFVLIITPILYDP